MRLGRPSPSPPLARRELALAAAGGGLTAVAVTWPLVTHLRRGIAHDLGDPLVEAWQVAWGGHALIHQPLDFFHSNMFWPLANSLAFSDALAGYAPAGLIGHGLGAAVVRYNLLFLFAYALAFVGAYLLARELGLSRAAAAVGGLAFAYTPFRLGQNAHLNILSSGGIPLALFLLLRGYRRRSVPTVIAGWLVATWQVSLGFNLGLPLAYLLGAGLALGGILWLRHGRPPLPRAMVVATAVGGAAFLLVTGLIARPYLQVARDHPEARHSLAEVTDFSPPPGGFLVAPGEDPVWGRVGEGLRRSLKGGTEETLFPGVAILLLAVAGIFAPASPKRLRLGLAAAVGVAAVFSMGMALLGGRLTYRLLYDYAPGWQGLRTPGRLMTFGTLALAMLAGLGAERLLSRRAAGRGRGATVWRLAPVVLAAGAILAEASGWTASRPGVDLIAGQPHPRVPAVPSGQLGAPAPQLHLPATSASDFLYPVWSTDGFPAILNGRGSFAPRSWVALLGEVRGFPDRASVATLRGMGVRSVVLHPDLAAHTAWSDWRRRPTAGLPVTREFVGGVVLYRLRPSTHGGAQ